MADITITLTDEEVSIVGEALFDYIMSWNFNNKKEKAESIMEKIRREKENTPAGEADEQEWLS